MSIRTKVEHLFFYIKQMFGYSKVRYRGLEKNTNRLYALAGLTTNETIVNSLAGLRLKFADCANFRRKMMQKAVILSKVLIYFLIQIFFRFKLNLSEIP